MRTLRIVTFFYEGASMSASSTEKILGKSKKKKSKKGLIIGISIAAAAAALLLITYGLNVVPGKLIRDKLSPAADTADETAYMPVTATAVVMDVQQKLTVTGKVISNAEQIENAHATDGQETTGYIVDQVNVKVGDTVKAGDVLYTIDMTKTEKRSTRIPPAGSTMRPLRPPITPTSNRAD